jgi:hypothetical protein
MEVLVRCSLQDLLDADTSAPEQIANRRRDRRLARLLVPVGFISSILIAASSEMVYSPILTESDSGRKRFPWQTLQIFSRMYCSISLRTYSEVVSKCLAIRSGITPGKTIFLPSTKNVSVPVPYKIIFNDFDGKSTIGVFNEKPCRSATTANNFW